MLKENSVEVALEQAAGLVGGWNVLVGKLNRSRDIMRIWCKDNRVPPEMAKTIEELTDSKVQRSQLNDVFL